jgi:hypothetical protein
MGMLDQFFVYHLEPWQDRDGHREDDTFLGVGCFMENPPFTQAKSYTE